MAKSTKAVEPLPARSSTPADPAKGIDDTAAEATGDAAVRPAARPMANLILADLVLRGGGALLRRAVERNLLGSAPGKSKAAKIIKGRGIGQTLLGSAAVRIATRSVPGAIIVGGGLLAKTLYDRKKRKAAAKD